MKRSTLKAAVLILLTFISLITIGYTGNYLTRTTGLRSLFPSFGGDIIGDAEAGKKTGVELPVAIEELNAPVRGDNSIEVLAIPTSAFRVSLGRARLSGPAGSLGENTMLSVNALKEDDLPPLEMGMVNVTGTHAAFRMLPHGILFNNDIDIVLPYDKSLLPMGFTENDIRTYYYDEHYGSWIMIELDSVDISNGVVVSRVNHFTDFINAIMKAPEMPETNAYVPTTMSDIQAGNPMESLTLIQPPSANNSGSANLSYPIDIPAGRNGMQPNLNITYNSGGGSGWLGLGWDLNIPMVTIDTRWGVPRYEPDKESETYLLNGEQLVTKDEQGNFNPLSHRAEWLDRMGGDVQFYPRVEGAFNKIIRHGESPSDYWWEVIDKTGTRYFYGKKLGEDVVDPQAVLTDGYGRIGKWGLTEIRDLNDNFVYYTYNVNSFSTLDEAWMYPKKIIYTGHNITQGKYSIEFKSVQKPHNINSNGRLGLKEVDKFLLSDIKISYNNEVFKRYHFCYTTGTYNKMLLREISEILPGFMNEECDCNSGEDRLITHKFEYYGLTEDIFGSPVTIYTGNDPQSKGLFSPIHSIDPSSLGGTSSVNWNIGGAITVGTGFIPVLKTLTAGGNYTRSGSDTKGLLTIIDMDGDGLPDKVFKDADDGKLYYRKQIYDSENDGYVFSGERKQLKGLRTNSFQNETSRTNDWGYEAHVNLPGVIGGTRSKNESKTTSVTDIYIQDVNSDGLPDIIQEGYVYFNHLDGEGVPYFSVLSEDARVEGGECVEEGGGAGPGPGTGGGSISTGEPITLELFTPGREVVTCYIFKETIVCDTVYIKPEEEVYPPHDLVKLWIAPYNGKISIDSKANFTNDLMEVRRSTGITDGLRVSMQVGDTIVYSDINTHRDSISAVIKIDSINIKRGDHIYFRIESKKSKTYDKVIWNPVITYNTIDNIVSYINSDNIWSKDADGNHIYRFSPSSDFLINPERYYYMPFDGKVAFESLFKITSPLSSDIEVKVYHNGNSIYSEAFPKGHIAEANIDFLYNDNDTVHDPFVVSYPDSVWCVVSSRTNVNWNAIEWTPKLYYIESYDENFRNDYLYNNFMPGGPKPNIIYNIIPYFTDYPKPVLPTGVFKTGRTIYPTTMNIRLTGASGSGSYIFSIKDDNGTVLERSVYITGSSTFSISGVELNPGIEYYFDLYCLNPNICSRVTSAKCTFSDQTVGIGLHTLHNKEDAIFGNLHRNWGQFNYLNNTGEYTTPINKNYLKLSSALTGMAEDPESYFEYEYEKDTFLMMTADYVNKQWVGYGNMNYIVVDTMSNTHPLVINDGFMGNMSLGNIEPSPMPTYSIEGAKATAPKKVSYLESTSNVSGAAIAFANFGEVTNRGNSIIKTDFMDMNGDRYPDIVTEYEINYTQPQGGLSTQKLGHVIPDEHSGTKIKSESATFKGSSSNYGASFSNLKISDAGKKNRQIELTGNAGVSRSVGVNEDYLDFTWMDINGDGLPDRVINNNSYHLNLGYIFKTLENINLNENIKKGTSKSVGGSAGGGGDLELVPQTITDRLGEDQGYNVFGTSFSGGLGFNTTVNTTQSLFMDINGDGLPDKLEMEYEGNVVYVRYNMSNGAFMPQEILLENARIFGSQSFTSSINGAVSFGFTVPVLFFTLKFVTNPKGGGSWGINQVASQFIDMDGDGLPDYVSSPSIDSITVRYNQGGKANLVKTVKNIANGNFELDYELSKNSFDSPNRTWTMSKLKVFDGFEGDGIDIQWFKFEYDSARYQRFDREDLGFKYVITKQLYSSDTSVYRTTTEKYHNANYIRKGLKEYELLTDKDNNKYIEKIYNYALHDIERGSVISEDDFCTGTGYPALKEEKVNYYEGSTQPRIMTRKTYEYGKYGNVTKYTNSGDIHDDSDDLIVDITYNTNYINKNITGTPKELTVKDNFNNLLRRCVLTINAVGNILQYRKYNGSSSLFYQYTYDSYGNVKKVTHPYNKSTQRMVYEYTYDSEINTYPVQVKDVVFNLSSGSTYDYKWGKPLITSDVNGYNIYYSYDWRGRLSKVTAPGERDYSILFHYWFENDVTPIGSEEPNIPWAVTYHNDKGNPGNPMTTTLFCDALGRVLQTQKDHQISNSEMIVASGRVSYDSFGRVSQQRYPVLINLYNAVPDPHSRPGTPLFSRLNDPSRPTTYEYDILDRETTVTTPDGKSTSFYYITNLDHSGLIRFITRIIDPEGNISYLYKDSRGLQTESRFSLEGNTVKTTFTYNAMGELVSSKDPDNIETLYEYDMFGRQTKRIHPDAGTDIYEYDMAGNLVSHKTQKLINENKQIDYIYDYNRLTEIRYPDNPENNVKYTYGAYNGAGSRGRVSEIEDASGWHKFTYDRYGNVNQHTRTIVLPNESQPYTFVMTYVKDLWNRVTEIIYSDGERVKYTYDRGGNLKTVTGTKGSTTFNYITNIIYDRFGKKTAVYYGNNTRTNYLYDVMQRLENMKSYINGGSQLIQDLTYSYDDVGNITSVENSAGIHSSGLGGRYTNTYEYDDLYRLKASKGEFSGHEIFYKNSLSMSYENNGRIKNKNYSESRLPMTIGGGSALHSTDNSVYNYNTSQPNTLKTVTRLRPNPSYSFTWDANGNMTKYSAKVMGWDEENRMTAAGDNTYNSYYSYDSNGERTYKLTGERQYLYVNGAGKYYNRLSNPTLYVSAYQVATSTGYTKHIYAGSERIVSKIGTGGLSKINFHIKQQSEWQPKQESSKAHLKRTLQDGINRPVEDSDITTNRLNILYNQMYASGTESEIYYYSTDHLGSSSWITNTAGAPIQHLQYLPFGGNYINQRASDWNSMYTFSGKEKDIETGFSYFGARYYDSGLGIWLSVDPLANKYPSLSPYVYAANNPIKYIDPNGMYVDEWNVDISTGEKTWVSDKGGDKTQHINLINEGSSITSLNIDGNKDVVNNLSNSIEKSGGWSLVGHGAYAGAGATAAAFGARGSVGKFEIYSEKGKEFTFTDVGTNIGYNAGVGAGLMFILGPSDIKGSDLGGWSTSISGGGGLFEVSFQTSATREGIPTFNYLTFSVGVAASIPLGGGISTSLTTVKSANKSLYYGPRPGVMYCFAEGTEIYTLDGLKEIQNMSVGDSVYSYDLEMDMVVSSVVTQKYISESDSIYKLKIDTEEIYVTGEHPFYIENKGWVKVKDLEIGNELLSTGKEKKILESKEIIIWKSKVYNFEVDGFHNYFITKSKILVHNK